MKKRKMYKDIYKLKIFPQCLCVLTIFVCCYSPQRLTVIPSPDIYISDNKINISAGLFIEDYQKNLVYSPQNLCLLTGIPSITSPWAIQTGLALSVGSERAFKKIFAEVEILNSISDFANKSLTVLIIPKIEKFYISQDLTAVLLLNCKLVDRDRNTLYENTIPARGSSQASTVFFLGMLGSKPALSKTSTEAFNNAFSLLIKDILKKVDFSKYMAK